MTISTSDWIAIIAATAQVVATLSIGVPQLMAMRPKTNPTDTQVNALTNPNNIKWLVKNVFVFVLSAGASVWIMWQALSTGGDAVTRSFVTSLVFGALWFSFSILSILGFVIAFAFRPLSMAIDRLAEKYKLN